MQILKIEGQSRSEFGKSSTRRLRAGGIVPGIIYGGSENVHFQAPISAFKNLIYTSKFQIAEISIDGKIYKTILKDLQFNTVTDELAHVDLLELVDGKRLNAEIPLKYTGLAIGVKDGGRLVIKMNKVKIRTTPEKLVEVLEVPVDSLELNGNLRVQDIKSEGIEIMNSPRIPIASVVTTRALRQAAQNEGKK